MGRSADYLSMTQFDLLNRVLQRVRGRGVRRNLAPDLRTCSPQPIATITGSMPFIARMLMSRAPSRYESGSSAKSRLRNRSRESSQPTECSSTSPPEPSVLFELSAAPQSSP